jgi:glycosyltransferase involved in cell wall biosynthesis
MTAPETSASAREPLASIVIPTCNRADLLAHCLDAVAIAISAAGARDAVEVIVTDDGGDDTSRVLVVGRYPWAIWLRGPRRGPAANRNHGARAARGGWLVFTDDDCVPHDDWLATIVERAGLTECSVLEGRTVADRERQRLDEESPENPRGGCLWSCNMAIRRSLFDRLGGFCETFPHAAMEDVDLRLRILGLGERLEFVPGAVVCHPFRRTKGIRFAPRVCQSMLHLVERHPSLLGPTPWRTMAQNWLRRASAVLRGGVRYRFRGFPYAVAALSVAVYYDIVAALRTGRRAHAAVAANAAGAPPTHET